MLIIRKGVIILNSVEILENTNAELRRDLIYFRQSTAQIIETLKKIIEKNNLKLEINMTDDYPNMLNDAELCIRVIGDKLVIIRLISVMSVLRKSTVNSRK